MKKFAFLLLLGASVEGASKEILSNHSCAASQLYMGSKIEELEDVGWLRYMGAYFIDFLLLFFIGMAVPFHIMPDRIVQCWYFIFLFLKYVLDIFSPGRYLLGIQLTDASGFEAGINKKVVRAFFGIFPLTVFAIFFQSKPLYKGYLLWFMRWFLETLQGEDCRSFPEMISGTHLKVRRRNTEGRQSPRSKLPSEA